MSTITESLRRRWFRHASSATSCAGKGRGHGLAVSIWRPRPPESFGPARRGFHLVGSSVGIPQLDVLLVLDSVEVLVQAVQQERQQLLAVVLLVAQELRGKVAHLGLQGAAERTRADSLF